MRDSLLPTPVADKNYRRPSPKVAGDEEAPLYFRSGSSSAITFATSNRAAGKTLKLKLKNTDTINALVVNGASWIHIPDGANAFSSGSYLQAEKTLLLKLTCWGTAETDVTAEWADESAA